MEQKQKKAYLNLYERVSKEIGSKMVKTVQQREAEIEEDRYHDEQLNAAELELKRIKQGHTSVVTPSLL